MITVKDRIREYLSYQKDKLTCFFQGHDIWYDYTFQSADGCIRCGLDIDDFFPTSTDILRNWYCWMVERDWKWFNVLDNWLIENHPLKLPSWWEY